jgi:hypothetical protein
LAVAMISPMVVRSASVAGRTFVERDMVRGFLFVAYRFDIRTKRGFISSKELNLPQESCRSS